MENETMKQNPATIKYIYVITLEYLYVFYYIVYNFPILVYQLYQFITQNIFHYVPLLTCLLENNESCSFT